MLYSICGPISPGSLPSLRLANGLRRRRRSRGGCCCGCMPCSDFGDDETEIGGEVSYCQHSTPGSACLLVLWTN